MLKKNNKPTQLSIAFLIPFIIIIISYIFTGIAPFGNSRSLMAMDAYSQYFPMLAEMKTGFSTWSFSGALGFNRLAQAAYYTNSPLWFILYLVPKRFLIGAIDMIVGLRFGLAGLTFCLWLQENYKTTPLASVAFSTAYSLSAYTLAFINQFMWMDIVVLLPIVAIGLNRLFIKQRPYIYILSLALALYSNFYIAYMVCLFSVLYFNYLCFREKISWKKRANRFLNFSISSLLSGSLVAFVLIPTYLALGKAISSSLGFTGELKFYHSPLKILAKLLPFSKISLAYEAPNLYCGLIVVLLCFAYLFKKNQALRARIIFVIFAAFAYFSINFNLFDFVWHGFHFPNQLPGRQSFIIIFAMISFAFSVFVLIENKRQKTANIIAVLLIGGIGINSVYTIYSQTWKSDLKKYTTYDADMEYVTNKYKSEEDFFRMEFLEPSRNKGTRYGYNGVGYYSSTMSANAYNFFERIGMGIYAKRVSTNYVPSNIVNAIFGVRYLIYTGEEFNQSLFIHEKEALDTLTLYENPYALPLAFLVAPSVLDLDMESGLDLQSEILRHMTGDKGKGAYSNEEDFAKAINKLKGNSLEITSFSKSKITGFIDCDKDGVLYTSIPNDGGWNIFVDGEKAEVLTVFDYLCGISLTEGKHTIKFIYRPPGLELGAMLSLASLAGFLIYTYKVRKKEKSTKDTPGP